MPCVAGRAAGREQLLLPPPSLPSLPNSDILEAAGGSRQQMLCASLAVSKGVEGNVALARLVLGVQPRFAKGEGCRFACFPWGHPTPASCCPCAKPGSPSAAPRWHKAGNNRNMEGTGRF